MVVMNVNFIKGTQLLFAFLMFIGTLGLIGAGVKFTTFEILSIIYIWVTGLITLSEAP